VYTWLPYTTCYVYTGIMVLCTKESLVTVVWQQSCHNVIPLGQKKLFFCFWGTDAFVFSPPASKFLFKESCSYFRQTKFCLKKIWQKNFAPSIRFFKKCLRTEDQFFWPYWWENLTLMIPDNDCYILCDKWVWQ